MWIKGHVSPDWDQSFKDISFEKRPYGVDTDVESWEAAGYIVRSFTGSLAGYGNPSIPAWASRFEAWYLPQCTRPLENIGLMFYKMVTSEVMPVHSDHFQNYIRKFDLVGQETKIWRSVIFLEDWRSGHYLEIDGEPVIKWRAGDFVAWQFDTPHMAANIGLEPRYTLQITGTLDE